MATNDEKTHDGVETTLATVPTGVSPAALGGGAPATTVAIGGGACPTTSEAHGFVGCTPVSTASPPAESAPPDGVAVPPQDGKRNENTVPKATPQSSELKVVTPPNTVAAVKRTTRIPHEEDPPAKKKPKTVQLHDLDSKVKIETAFKEFYPQRNIPDTLHEAIKSVSLNYTVKEMTSALKEKLGVEAPKAKKKSDVAHFFADQLLKRINHNKPGNPTVPLACATQSPTQSVNAS